jgi:hypothetical protein
VRIVDLVQLGSIAIAKPGIGTLYAQLVHGYLAGQALPDKAYATLLGVSLRTLQLYFDTLSRWGLVTRSGSTRSRKFVLGPTPNVVFCEDVVIGMYGPGALQEILDGKRVSAICAISEGNPPVVSYAVQQLLLVYGVQTFVPYALSEVSAKTGTGSIVSPDYRNFSPLVVSMYTYTNYIQILKYLKRGEIAQVEEEPLEYYTFSIDLPPGLAADKKITTPKQRAAKSKTYALPESSWAFLRWPDAKIQELDTEHYATIMDLIAYWNEQFGIEERYDRKLYCRLRNLLVEQGIAAGDVRRAIRGVRLDPWWGERAVLSSFANDPSKVRKFAKASQHDRLATGFNAIPRGEVTAVEF